MGNSSIVLPAHALKQDNWKTICENCSDTRTNKKDKSLSINTRTGLYNCHYCADKGMLESFKDVKVDKAPPKVYVRPEWQNNTNLSDALVKWFKGRGISQSTLMDCKVSEGPAFFPQINKEANAVQFNYFRGGSEPSNLINVKYRSGGKDFKLHKDAELILYGLENAKTKKKAIITEGEIDRLSFHEIGANKDYAIFSVPNGASITKEERAYYEQTGQFQDEKVMNLSYLDNSWKDIEHIEEWVIATDCDPPGLKLRRELLRRFGEENCRIVDFKEFKDANEVLQSRGGIELESCLKNAKTPPIKGVFDVDSQREDIYHDFEHGVAPGLPLGIKEIDPHLRFILGLLVIITGHPNHGKTSFVWWLVMQTAKTFGWKWALYCPENYPARNIYEALIEVYVGKTFGKKFMSREELDKALAFIHDHFYVVDSEEMLTPEELNDIFKKLVRSKGINGCLVDPWNDLYHQKKPGENGADYIQRQLSDIRRVKRKYNLFYVINAHPTVEAQRRREEHPEQANRQAVPGLEDIADGAMWPNRADIGITIYRNKSSTLHWKITELHITKVKDQRTCGIGTLKEEPILLQFNPMNKQYRPAQSSDTGGFKEFPAQMSLISDATVPKEKKEVKSDLPDFDAALQEYGRFRSNGVDEFENAGKEDEAPF